MPEAPLDACLQWSHLSSGHTGANRSVDFLRECFYSSRTLTELRSRMQTIVDACGCHASRQSDSRDRGLISGLPILDCANSLLYVDFIHGLPRFGGYDSFLVVSCGLSRFTRVFPCNKKITGEQTVKMLVEQWLEPYGAPKQVHSDEDLRICSDTGWYKRVLHQTGMATDMNTRLWNHLQLLLPSPHHAILTNHTCPEEGPLVVLCGDLHHHPKGTIHTIDLVGASITVVYVTLSQMRVHHHSGAHHTPFLQLSGWPKYRLFRQYLTQTARAAGHTLPGSRDMRAAYRDFKKQHPDPSQRRHPTHPPAQNTNLSPR